MTAKTIHDYIRLGLCGLFLAVALLRPAAVQAAAEQTFDVLQIGTKSYTNVTITTKSKDYVFIVYTGGMVNIKVADLPRDVLQKLGYVAPDPVGTPDDVRAQAANPAPVSAPQKLDLHNPGPWAGQKLAGLPMLQSAQAKKWIEFARAQSVSQSARVRTLDPVILYGALGGVLLGYLLFCYGCMSICRKAGQKGGALVWVPFLQLFPMLRAAGMSRWWVLAYLIPVFNVVAQIIWSFEIAKALRKSAFMGFLLILPGLNIFAFFYLAFSSGKPAEPVPRAHKEMMTLETA